MGTGQKGKKRAGAPDFDFPASFVSSNILKTHHGDRFFLFLSRKFPWPFDFKAWLTCHVGAYR